LILQKDKNKRVLFLIELVTALVEGSNSREKEIKESQSKEREAIKREREKLQDRAERFRKCERDLSDKINEFEDVFKALLNYKSTQDSSK